MKKFVFLPIAAMLLCASCGKNPPPATESYLTVENADGSAAVKLDFPTEGASRQLKIKSNAAWNAVPATNTTWIEISPESGTGDATVTVTAGRCSSESNLSGKILFYIGGRETASLTVEQLGTAPSFSATPDKTSVGSGGGDITFSVNTNIDGWRYEIEDGAWLTEKSKTADRLVLTAANYVSGPAERKAVVKFMQPSSATAIQTITLTQTRLIADLLDVAFNADGTATDLSPMKNAIQRVGDAGVTVYNNTAYECYVPRFSHSPATSVTSGYYKMDYRNSPLFKNALADGHTLETLFMAAVEPVDAESKPFSAHEGGGTGFLVTNGGRGNVITFLPHVGSAGYIWTTSGVKPEPGKYYHAVGVWNKQEGKSYVYVDGVLKNTVTTSGDLNFPGSAECHWFCVGGDASGSGAGNAWNGDVVLARVYDAPLTAAQVAELWDAVKDAPTSGLILITGLSYRQGKVQAGTDYEIKGNGFAAGDRIVFESTSNPAVRYVLAAASGDKSVTVVIPADMQSGQYMMTLERGGATSPLGVTSLTVTSEPVEQSVAGIIAHRGLHTTGITENTLASFRAADELGGVYGSECDFWITLDGVVVSNHDGKVNGLTVQDNNYYGTAMEGKVDLFKAYTDYMKANPSEMKLIIEIKSHKTTIRNRNKDCADAIISQVAEAGLNDRVEYIAFNYDLCVYLASQTPAGTVVGYLNGDKAPSVLAPAGIKCIDYNTDRIKANPGWIAEAHSLGMVVNVWTIINSTAEMTYFMDLGVDYITTDYPQTMKTLLEQL